MTRLLALSVCLASSAFAADVFPWDGAVTLTDAKGRTLTWTVKRVDGEVHITGTHPNWQVEHRAKPDGTPLTTTRRAKGETTRVAYSATGAQLERTNAKGEKRTVTVTEPGLWDGDTLDARMAGLDWSTKKVARMKVVDVDADLGAVYPMRVDVLAPETIAGQPCHHLKLGLDDYRRLFAPTYEYRYAAAPGAKYVRFDGDGFTFTAP